MVRKLGNHYLKTCVLFFLQKVFSMFYFYHLRVSNFVLSESLNPHLMGTVHGAAKELCYRSRCKVHGKKERQRYLQQEGSFIRVLVLTHTSRRFPTLVSVTANSHSLHFHPFYFSFFFCHTQLPLLYTRLLRNPICPIGVSH